LAIAIGVEDELQLCSRINAENHERQKMDLDIFIAVDPECHRQQRHGRAGCLVNGVAGGRCGFGMNAEARRLRAQRRGGAEQQDS
jgi:hypothetical protein